MAKKKSIKKSAKPKKRKVQPRKRITGMRKKPRSRGMKIGNVNQHIAIARHGLENQLAALMLKQYNATTKKAKRQLGKKIAELKSKIRKLK